MTASEELLPGGRVEDLPGDRGDGKKEADAGVEVGEGGAGREAFAGLFTVGGVRGGEDGAGGDGIDAGAGGAAPVSGGVEGPIGEGAFGGEVGPEGERGGVWGAVDAGVEEEDVLGAGEPVVEGFGEGDGAVGVGTVEAGGVGGGADLKESGKVEDGVWGGMVGEGGDGGEWVEGGGCEVAVVGAGEDADGVAVLAEERLKRGADAPGAEQEKMQGVGGGGHSAV